MNAAAGHMDRPAVLVIFILTYLGLAAGRVPGLKLDRTGIAILGAIALMVFGGLTTGDVVGYVNWPTILLLFGFFVISAQLRLSGFFDSVARAVARRLDHPANFLLLLMLATAGLSAFLNHDIVCYAFAPIVGAALLKRRINPVPFLVALAIASNIGAAATIVGNPQDMMIAQIAGLGFGRYALWCLPPVLVALGGAFGITWLLSRNQLQAVEAAPEASIQAAQGYAYNKPHTLKGLAILIVVIGLFFSPIPKEIVALTAAGIHLASRKFRTADLLGIVDWPILVLFMGLFVVTGAFETTGYGDLAVHWLAAHGLQLSSPVVLALSTAALSNLINNAAAVLLLLKVANVAHAPAAYVLALANSFGGSLVISGSVSNIIVVEQARELGIPISFKSFLRLGAPVTLAAMAAMLGWVVIAH